jgi:divalent metal cation (Fe/Co/Zn/Cd) transporter
MSDDRQTWIRHSFYLALFTAGFHCLQFAASVALWRRTTSPALMSFGLDASVSAIASLVLATRIQREWRHRFVAYGYMAASAVAFYLGASMLWKAARPAPTVLGIVLAAVSMLVIPIIGSYMKVLAVELRSQALKSAAIFTFGNSYLSMVLLIASLLNYGMNLGWGDPLGALVMFPFMAQKGIQILLEEGKHEYVED